MVTGFKGEASLIRSRIVPVVVALASLMFTPTPVQANGVWDPDEPGHRLDIRWVGVRFLGSPDGPGSSLMRLTITFYDPLQLYWFQDQTRSRFFVAFDPQGHVEATQSQTVGFFRGSGPRHKLLAQFCEAGSAGGSLRVVGRPTPTMLRVVV